MALNDDIKIKINQNLWALFISFATLGASEYYDLKVLLKFGIFTSFISCVSFLFTIIAYTINYWRDKMNKR